MNLYKCNDIVFASHKTYFFLNYVSNTEMEMPFWR